MALDRAPAAPLPDSLNLSGRGLRTIPPDLLDSDYANVDVSGNELTSLRDLDPISTGIVTLNVSKNRLPDSAEIPYMPRLRSLYASNNDIELLDIFIEKLCVVAPGLEELVLVNNRCHPGVLESQAKVEYRIYIASRFPNMKTIDGTSIGAFERQEARRLLRLVGLE